MIPSLAELLENALRGAGLEATSDIWRIAESWREAVGERIAARAAPVRLRRGELLVAAPDAVWRQELALLGPEIAARVNRKVGKNLVERVRLVGGSATAVTVRPPQRRVLRAAEPAGDAPPPGATEAAGPSSARRATAGPGSPSTRSATGAPGSPSTSGAPAGAGAPSAPGAARAARASGGAAGSREGRPATPRALPEEIAAALASLERARAERLRGDDERARRRRDPLDA